MTGLAAERHEGSAAQRLGGREVGSSRRRQRNTRPHSTTGDGSSVATHVDATSGKQPDAGSIPAASTMFLCPQGTERRGRRDSPERDGP